MNSGNISQSLHLTTVRHEQFSIHSQYNHLSLSFFTLGGEVGGERLEFRSSTQLFPCRVETEECNVPSLSGEYCDSKVDSSARSASLEST